VSTDGVLLVRSAGGAVVHGVNVRIASTTGDARMSTAGLPTIWELVAEGAATLPEPFSRAALINWVSARRPEVGVSSIAAHIQAATANAGHNQFAEREPLLHRVGRGQYVRYRPADVDVRQADVRTGRVVLIGSSGATGSEPGAVGRLFRSDGFARAREHAVHSRLPWFVLSAKHGLLDPDDVISPYEIQIDDQPAAYRSAWGEWVVAQLADRVQLDGVLVEVHGGVDFAQPLRHPLARRGATLEIPLPGTWRESRPDRPEDAHDGGATAEPVDAPVRVALDRLRSLVGRHRAHTTSDDADRGHASAS
jgi:hypothetical protein